MRDVWNIDKKKATLFLIGSLVSCSSLCYKCSGYHHEELLSRASGRRNLSSIRALYCKVSKSWSVH
jgi:hypothetical protein